MRQEQPPKSGIYTRYKPMKMRPYLFLILLALIIVSLWVMKKSGQTGRTDSDPAQAATEQAYTFKKEGNLTFMKPDSTVIVTIDIEIADDDLQRETGLMYRREMDMMTGMLFIFEEEDNRSFWMKNTWLPLDILYLDAGRSIVSIHENTPPRSEQSIPSGSPAKYVVEVVAGFTALYDIRTGDQISFQR